MRISPAAPTLAAAGFLLAVAMPGRAVAVTPRAAPAPRHATALVAQQDPDLRTMSLEDLMGLEVTSVSKRRESVFAAPAAVYAITAEEIRRSGLRSLPEVLRLAPGVEVAQIDASKWAITVRGDNGRFANKLLVMIDGRSVYTPLFSGVLWELQHVLLEDIERIEVIRGPGGALWGANAVNGIINIITKAAADTTGGFAEAGAGTEEHGFGSFRYGATRGNVDWRAYGMGFARDEYLLAPGVDANDAWRGGQGGFRLDWHRSARDEITLQGDLFTGSADATEIDRTAGGTAPGEADLGMGNVLGRWHHVLEGGSTTTLQLYYDRLSRQGSLTPGEVRNTFDVDLQMDVAWHDRHQLVVGGGYRVTDDDPFGGAFPEGGQTLQLWSLFAQDQIALLPGRLSLTVGSKLEHNDFTGFEVQPSARLLWLSDDRLAAWAAVSRAVRTPSRGEDAAEFALESFQDPQTGLPGVVRFIGNPDLSAETLLAYEVGFRAQASERFYFDVAAYAHDYDHSLGVEEGTPFVELDGIPLLVVPLRAQSNESRRAAGFEAFGRMQAAEGWQVAAGYSFLDFAAEASDVGGLSPRHQLQLRSYLDLPHDLEVDGALYFTGALPTDSIDRYGRLDVRIGWRPADGLELSLALFNLLDETHQEFGPSASIFEVPSLVQRSGYGMIRWRF